MLKVYKAKPYKAFNVHSLGRASYMFIRQFQFPEFYDEHDVLLSQDSDRMDEKHLVSCCIENKTGVTSQMNLEMLENWALEAHEDAIMAFLVAALKVQRKQWTGFRIMASIKGNGHAVWHFQLFYKHPKSEVTLYTGENAPNVVSR